DGSDGSRVRGPAASLSFDPGARSRRQGIQTEGEVASAPRATAGAAETSSRWDHEQGLQLLVVPWPRGCYRRRPAPASGDGGGVACAGPGAFKVVGEAKAPEGQSSSRGGIEAGYPGWSDGSILIAVSGPTPPRPEGGRAGGGGRCGGGPGDGGGHARDPRRPG